jgi:hypothetical protein
MGDLQLYGMTNLAVPYFQATQFELVINLGAKELGIEMSPELVAGAYAVIE